MSNLYSITIERNGETIKKRSNDIKKVLEDTRPDDFLTDMYLTISKGAGKKKETIERRVPRQMFKNIYLIDTTMEVFINNLHLQ